ncbi:MAG: quinone-dependent dihydroorotate dehydrogenase [Ardenticatenaceae bacterium]|nr:quinone-dependent dihydroorotate dehydrogenase [Ardenticatenaceae bacterium]MCB9443014.1 quinone-dependent dihydroorotate dehydrogenase [Ardenticatenaceae bacterium]
MIVRNQTQNIDYGKPSFGDRWLFFRQSGEWNWYKRLVFPFLAQMDAEQTHEWMLSALTLAQRTWPGQAVLRAVAGDVAAEPVELFGLTFPNVLGIAAGFDKDVRIAAGLGMLGFGHVEVGTLLPRPQAGNARPRVFRLPEDGAVINRMGFPNVGVDTAVSRLQSLKKSNLIVGASLGKQKETPLEDAADDYRAVMRAVYPYADYLAVNISSPNTPGLRQLQGRDYLSQLLADLQLENRMLAQEQGMKQRPLLVKIAPDLTWAELDEMLTAVSDHQIDGIIATNTTLARKGLSHPNQQEQGGLSGRPLRQRSNEIIRYIYRQTEGRLPIIGVGGVQTAADVRQKLEAGASLVQIFTGLIYEGPGLAGRILREI